MIRALFVNQYYWPDISATAQHLADLAEFLVEQGFAVDVLCSRAEYEATGATLPLEESYRGVGIRRLSPWGKRTKGVASRLLGYTGFHLQCMKWIALHRGKYDAIVTLTDPPLVGLHAMLARSRVKHIFWCMDLCIDCVFALGTLRRSTPLGWMLDGISRVELKHADAVVALGECMRERLVNKGVMSEKIRVIGAWNRADQLWPTPVERNGLRALHGLTDKFVVMYSGNAGRSHAFDAIRYAIGALRNDPRIVFLFVGGGKRIEEIDSFVEREKLTNVVKLPYFPRDRLNESLAMGDVHLVSLHERMAGVVVPSKLYGAFAVGRTVVYIGPQESTMALEIKEADAGVSITNEDGPGLVRTIEHLATSPEECKRLGENGRAFFLRKHERLVCGEAWAELLREVVGRAGAL